MTGKASLIFTATVAAFLFSFTAFAQDQGQKASPETGEKTITYNDLLAQKTKITELKTSYTQSKADYNATCVEKTISTEADQKICKEKYDQITKLSSDLKNETASFNKNVAQYKAKSSQQTADSAGPSVKGN